MNDPLPPLFGQSLLPNLVPTGTGGYKPIHPGVNASSQPIRSFRAACAVALHMHQPLIPAGGDDLPTARIISNLEQMMMSGNSGDSYNAHMYYSCYRRMGDMVPEYIDQGYLPRVMLDYSGELLYGLSLMGATDVIERLKLIATDVRYRDAVEWLGTAWGHAVAPSTPPADFRLHVEAWRQQFAAMFGIEALLRVKGFSPPEMALPNHPDVAYEFVKTLRESGYEWVLVQEDTVEQPSTGSRSLRPHVPHMLCCKNSRGEEVSIVAIIKTKGSDTKLVGQMQPWYEAAQLAPQPLGAKGTLVPPLVTQIADGENGGVMMNEFPGKFAEVVRTSSHTPVPLMNVSEYLECLRGLGVVDADFPVLQPKGQKRIWDRVGAGVSPEAIELAVSDIKLSEASFSLEGGSWTNDLSWVRGYGNLLDPMQEQSVRFHQLLANGFFSRGQLPEASMVYQQALYYLLLSQTSCFRYWGQGRWVEYGREFCRRLQHVMA
jgi:hypothetical protein